MIRTARRRCAIFVNNLIACAPFCTVGAVLKIGLETSFWVESVLPSDGAVEIAARKFFTKMMHLPEH